MRKGRGGKIVIGVINLEKKKNRDNNSKQRQQTSQQMANDDAQNEEEGGSRRNQPTSDSGRQYAEKLTKQSVTQRKALAGAIRGQRNRGQQKECEQVGEHTEKQRIQRMDTLGTAARKAKFAVDSRR
uniref:Small EDRK-rich factor-like N-terminal domain-containing protein n=1 Tax=Globodera rostochiensis TaxID=31243 RepID=A0A914HU09_GLORO